MNLAAMTDAKLSSLYADVRDEYLRRLLDGNDPETVWNSIRSQEAVKRAITVAAVRLHRVLLVGPPKCGKTMFVRAAAGLGVAVREEWPCPCGYFGDYSQGQHCECRLSAKKRHMVRLKKATEWAQIVVRVPSVGARELLSPFGTTYADTLSRVRTAGTIPSVSDRLSEDTRRLLLHAERELHYGAAHVRLVIDISKSIARLAGTASLEMCHVAEAIQYVGRLPFSPLA